MARDPNRSIVSDSTRLEAAIESFEAAWQLGDRPAIDGYLLPDSDPGRRQILVELVHTEMEFRLKAGERARVEEYLGRYPELAGDEAVVRAFAEREYRLRSRVGTISADEFPRRFPAFAAMFAQPQQADRTPLLPGPLSDTAEPLTTDAPDGVSLPAVPGFLITRELARGGMGRVLAATDLTLDREVAIKVLLPGHSVEEATRRFVRESKITARLPHPGIPPVHELGTLADGSPFLAMKLIRGRTLAQMLAERQNPADNLSQFVQVFEQICQARRPSMPDCTRGGPHRQIELLRSQFAQSDGRSFADVLPAERIERALREEGAGWRHKVYTLAVTLWAFLTQVASPDGSCRAAVARVLAGLMGQAGRRPRPVLQGPRPPARGGDPRPDPLLSTATPGTHAATVDQNDPLRDSEEALPRVTTFD